VKLQVISVGRVKADPAAAMVDDYIGRIGKFLPVEDLVLKVEDEERVAERMLKAADQSTLLIAMDEGGRLFNSYEFSELVSSWMNAGLQRVTFVIGGAAGLSPKVLAKADLKIGLSRMTLPHRFARLLLAEQLYRALCIIRNVPYQK